MSNTVPVVPLSHIFLATVFLSIGIWPRINMKVPTRLNFRFFTELNIPVMTMRILRDRSKRFQGHKQIARTYTNTRQHFSSVMPSWKELKLVCTGKGVKTWAARRHQKKFIYSFTNLYAKLFFSWNNYNVMKLFFTIECTRFPLNMFLLWSVFIMFCIKW